MAKPNRAAGGKKVISPLEAARLLAAFEAAGRTQTEVAAGAGMSPSALSRVLSGKYRELNRAQYERLTAVLGVPQMPDYDGMTDKQRSVMAAYQTLEEVAPVRAAEIADALVQSAQALAGLGRISDSLATKKLS